MPEELNIEEVVDTEETPTGSPAFPDEPPKGWLDGIIAAVGKAVGRQESDEDENVQKASPKAIAAAAKMLGVQPAALARAMQGMGGGEEDEEDMPTKTKKDDEAPPVEKGQPPVPAVAQLVKAEVEAFKAEFFPMLQEVQKDRDSLKKDNEQLRADLDGIRSDRDVEKAARRKVEAINKAETLLRLPTSSTELADLLIKAEDGLSEEDYKKFEALLKATDRQLYAAGFFGEIGTSRSPEQVTIEDKVAKSDKSPEEALLDLSPEDQAMLQKEWDEQSRGGK